MHAEIVRGLGKRNTLRGITFGNFVSRSGKFWTSLTGRKPSTRRIERIDGDDPKFVLFVKELAKIGNAAEPSRKEIEIALRNLRATD
jgi:hypothetical protein